MKIISILFHIISYIIYICGCIWFGLSLRLISNLTINDIELYLIMLPTVIGFMIFNKLKYKIDIIVYFLTLIYFIFSLSFFTGMSIFDINIYLVFLPVTTAFSIYKFNSIINNKKFLIKLKNDKNSNVL